MGSKLWVAILFCFAGFSASGSDIQFDELITQSSNEQLQVAADLGEEPSGHEEIYLNVQKKQNTSAQLTEEDENDGLKVVLKKKKKKKKKKKPASVSSPVIVPIKGN